MSKLSLASGALVAAVGLFASGAYAQSTSPSGAAAGGAMKLSQSECDSVWNKAGASGDSLTMSQAQPYVGNFANVDTNKDGKLSRAEFNQGCDQGLIKSTAASGAGAGTSGAGSSSSGASGSSSSGSSGTKK